MMALLRRRRLPPQLEHVFAAFVETGREVDAARSAIIECAPSTRFAGRWVPEALSAFEEHLGAAAARMNTWRSPQMDDAWSAANDGLDKAQRLAERLRLEAPQIDGFERLIGLIDSLIAPLDAFDRAEEVFRSLRV
jgi:hypothetical protein